MIIQTTLEIETRGRSAHELTQDLRMMVNSSGITTGLCQLFIQHTSASLMICENADPQVLKDLEAFFSRLVRDGDPLFQHTSEGADDMPAHIRSVLTQCDLSVPISNGKCALGTWQGIYLWEHRVAAHKRRVMVTLYGD